MMPTKQECIELIDELEIPANVQAHSLAVASLAKNIAEQVFGVGSEQAELLEKAGMLHDICKVSSDRHESCAADLLREKGYDAIAKLVENHALTRILQTKPMTTEEKILYYADKCVMEDKVVGVHKRFEDLRERYGKDEKAIKLMNECENATLKLEKELTGGSYGKRPL